VKSGHQEMSANDPKRTLAFLGHLALYEPNDRCDDRPSDAAANCLTEESANIHAAGCTAQHRHKRGEDLTSNAASNCTRDGVARRAEAHVLRYRTRCIATECTGYNLNYEIDECSRHRYPLANKADIPTRGRDDGMNLSALHHRRFVRAYVRFNRVMLKPAIALSSPTTRYRVLRCVADLNFPVVGFKEMGSAR
jgi:hypothetical protein